MDNKELMSKLGRRARRQQCVPVISHYVTSEHLFPTLDSAILFQDPFLAAKWADTLGYPMDEDKHIFPRVAQYAYIVNHKRSDFDAKMDYLDFLKKELCDQAQERKLVDIEVINAVRSNLAQLTVTEIALNLRITDIGRTSSSILALFARMPFEVYLTTTPFKLMEEALAANGKPDYVSKCYLWNEQEISQEEIAIAPNPTVDKPVVYHLQGIEDDLDTIVFTEGDYFTFFKQLAQDLRNEVQSDNRLPPVINGLLGRRSLMLLGYSMFDWSFRSFFRGPFRESVNLRTRGVTAQFPPHGNSKQEKKIREYLTEFFEGDKFDLYWGSIEQFANELMLSI